jgi:hypothetical protein
VRARFFVERVGLYLLWLSRSVTQIQVLRWFQSFVQSHLDGIEWSEEESPGIRDGEQYEVFIKTLWLFSCRILLQHIFVGFHIIAARRSWAAVSWR